MHKHNTYFICKKDEEVIGMIAYSERRPFSLESKFQDIGEKMEDFLQDIPDIKDRMKMFELRLFAIKSAYRGSRIFINILYTTLEHALKKNCKLGVCSAITGNVLLYNNMGCIAFGHLIGHYPVIYQPMYFSESNMTLFLKRFKRYAGNSPEKTSSQG